MAKTISESSADSLPRLWTAAIKLPAATRIVDKSAIKLTRAVLFFLIASRRINTTAAVAVIEKRGMYA